MNSVSLVIFACDVGPKNRSEMSEIRSPTCHRLGLGPASRAAKTANDTGQLEHYPPTVIHIVFTEREIMG